MKYYQAYLTQQKITVHYIEANDTLVDLHVLLEKLNFESSHEILYIDTTDNWLEKKINNAAKATKVNITKHSTPLFMTDIDQLHKYFNGKKRMYQTDFYKHQRIYFDVLIEKDSAPTGGKWTFDAENRLKYPSKKTPPSIATLPINTYYEEAIDYTEKNFGSNYGILSNGFIYPTTYDESKNWLKQFFETRFLEFGEYEDAIVQSQLVLHHSVLTPMLNVGLISPQFVIDEAIKYANQNHIPINSLEGFVRQIMGWREFIRAVYEIKGTEERNKNFFKFNRPIPESFWNGTTGIAPIDETIKKVLKTGYCHHIERLMVLGNFMLLCEFDPDEVYRWFMELFIDAYDWVMVPNVYGMSQFADGGLMATKPYISGSNYIIKMSDYKKGEWQPIWDGLFWRFMHTHRGFFLSNPRLGMLVHTFDKMPIEKQNLHINNAEHWLNSLT
jgi:deoxyribodipyrimidine photolyase-related protein